MIKIDPQQTLTVICIENRSAEALTQRARCGKKVKYVTPKNALKLLTGLELQLDYTGPIEKKIRKKTFSAFGNPMGYHRRCGLVERTIKT